MKALLDEMLPRRLRAALRSAGLDACAFPNEWKGLKNGELLDRMSAEGFACLITSDKNLLYQQSFAERSLSVLVLPASRYTVLEPIARKIVEAANHLEPRTMAGLDQQGEMLFVGRLER